VESKSRRESEELTSWKEIAQYLGVAVRTAQIWETERNLPVRRLPGAGRGRVSALCSELDAWKESGRSPFADPTPDLAKRPSKRGAIGLVAAGIVAAGIVGLAVAGLAIFRPHTPATFRIEHKTLVVLDETGRECWRVVYPDLDPGMYQTGIQRFWAGDLDGDGQPEVLFIPIPSHPGATGTQVICYSSRGAERWRFVPGKFVRTRAEEFSPPFIASWFTVEPLGPNGSLRIVVESSHHLWYPTQVAMLDARGRLVREYWHSGGFGPHATLSRDGRRLLALGGINNGSKRAVIVLLDPERFGGASVEENADYQLLDMPKATAASRLLFPRSCINRQLEPYGSVAELDIEPDGLSVSVLENENSTVVYRLDAHLGLRSVSVSSMFERVHAELFAGGTLDHPLSRAERDAFRAVSYDMPDR
jgi:hypothetical protein